MAIIGRAAIAAARLSSTESRACSIRIVRRFRTTRESAGRHLAPAHATNLDQ
jgi:hypothetical protein